MRKRELVDALAIAEQKLEWTNRDIDFWRKQWNESVCNMSAENKRARQALDVALNLNPYYTTKFCPKCATAIEDRQYVQAGKYLPQHLVWTCKCGYVMYTRTSEDTK